MVLYWGCLFRAFHEAEPPWQIRALYLYSLPVDLPRHGFLGETIRRLYVRLWDAYGKRRHHVRRAVAFGNWKWKIWKLKIKLRHYSLFTIHYSLFINLYFMEIKSAEFVISNTDVRKCPEGNKPEYAFIGRSNVGKSSLINMLTNKKAWRWLLKHRVRLYLSIIFLSMTSGIW